MVKNIHTTVASTRQILGRKAFVVAGSVAGGIIALLVAAKMDPESTEIVTIEETTETIIEIDEKENPEQQ